MEERIKRYQDLESIIKEIEQYQELSAKTEPDGKSIYDHLLLKFKDCDLFEAGKILYPRSDRDKKIAYTLFNAILSTDKLNADVNEFFDKIFENEIHSIFSLLEQKRYDKAREKTRDILKLSPDYYTALRLDEFINKQRKEGFFEKIFAAGLEKIIPYVLLTSTTIFVYNHIAFSDEPPINSPLGAIYGHSFFDIMLPASIIGLAGGYAAQDIVRMLKLPLIHGNEYINKLKLKLISSGINTAWILFRNVIPGPKDYEFGSCEPFIAGILGYYVLHTLDDIERARKTEKFELLIINHIKEALNWYAKHTKLVTAIAFALPCLSSYDNLTNPFVFGCIGYASSSILRSYLEKEEPLPITGSSLYEDSKNFICNHRTAISAICGISVDYLLKKMFVTTSGMFPNYYAINDSAAIFGFLTYFSGNLVLNIARSNILFDKMFESIENKLAEKKPLIKKLYDRLLKDPGVYGVFAGLGTMAYYCGVLQDSINSAQIPLSRLDLAISASLYAMRSLLIGCSTYIGMSIAKGLFHSSSINTIKYSLASNIYELFQNHEKAIDCWQNVMKTPTIPEKDIENKIRLANLHAKNRGNIDDALDLYMECMGKNHTASLHLSPIEWAKKTLFLDSFSRLLRTVSYVCFPTLDSKISFSLECLKNKDYARFGEVWQDIIQDKEYKDNPNLHCLAAYCFEKIDYKEEAVDAFRKCIEILAKERPFLDTLRSVGDHKVYVIDPSKTKFKQLANTFVIKETKDSWPEREFIFLNYLKSKGLLKDKAVEAITYFHNNGKDYYVMRHATKPAIIDFFENISIDEAAGQIGLILDSLAVLHRDVILESKDESDRPYFVALNSAVNLDSFEYGDVLVSRAFKGKPTDSRERLGMSSDLDEFLGLFCDIVLNKIYDSNKYYNSTILHGDFYATNVLKDGIIIDFDRICIGNPLDDLSHFFSKPNYNGFVKRFQEKNNNLPLEEFYLKDRLGFKNSEAEKLIDSYGHRLLFNSLCLTGAMLNQGNYDEAKEYMAQSADLMRKINAKTFDSFAKYIKKCNYPEFIDLL